MFIYCELPLPPTPLTVCTRRNGIRRAGACSRRRRNIHSRSDLTRNAKAQRPSPYIPKSTESCRFPLRIVLVVVRRADCIFSELYFSITEYM